MNHLVIPGCWYCDALPNGGYIASVINQPLNKTNNGDKVGHKLLWTVIAPNGNFCGAGHEDDIAWEWNGQWNNREAAQGSHPIVYKADNSPEIVHNVVGAPTGSQGYRYLSDEGLLIHSDDTIAPGAKLAIQYNITNLWQFTVRDNGKLVVGELQDGVGARVNGVLVRINSLIPNTPKQQQSRDVNFKIDGNRFCISWYYFLSPTDVTACFLWGTIDELKALAPEEPIPVPISDEVMIKAFDRPMWQAPYFSHHTRYGDTSPDKHVGNAIVVLDDDENKSRFNNLGMPLIVESPLNDNLTVAYIAHGADMNELVNKVNIASSHPEKPIIAYLDGDGWPESNPFNSERIWPSIQAYRFPSESLSGFESRMDSVINRVSTYKLPMSLVTRFDDFNGSSSVLKTLECMLLYEEWLRDFFFVVHMPFADRRGNGISKNNSLWNFARAFQFAIPSERPNRFDYWKPAASSVKDVLINKLGQQRAAVVLENYLREDILKKYEQNNPGPIEPPPTQEWPNLLPTINTVRNKYPALVSKDQSVAILNEVAWIHRNDGFGLLKKDGGVNGPQPKTGTLCSVDWLISKKHNRGLDCLGAAPNNEMTEAPANPQWHDGESPVDLTRFIDPVQP